MGIGENIERRDAQICQDKLSLSTCALFCGIDNLSSTKYLLERCSYGRIVRFVLVLQIASPCFYAKHGSWVRASLCGKSHHILLTEKAKPFKLYIPAT